MPVIHRAEEVTLRGVARRIRDLAERARGRQLNADDIAGGTFSITNDGPFGTYFTVPIINQPQVAILATDGIARRPVVVTQRRRVRVDRHPLDRRPRRQLGPPGRRRRLRLAVPGPGGRTARHPRLGRRALRAGTGAAHPLARDGPVPRGVRRCSTPWPREADDDYLLLLQHPHVYTLGAHADDAPRARRPGRRSAPTLERTDRGGDVTYHGPGQLVAYPIVTVPDDPASGPAHVHRLEQVVIDTLADLGLPGATSVGRVPGRLGRRRRAQPAQDRRHRRADAERVGARRRRTLHGVALNVTTDLAMFGHIVPCGIADRGVTSLAAEGIDVTMDDVPTPSSARAAAVFGTEGVERRDVVTGPAALARTATAPASARCCAACARPAWRPRTASTSRQRKPAWVRVPVRIGKGYRQLGATIHDLGLVTVCEEAGCPNIYECWADGTATFMINGERCTRACGFCQVDTRHPLPLAPDEPERVAEAVAAHGPRPRRGHVRRPRRPGRRRRRLPWRRRIRAIRSRSARRRRSRC